MRRLIKYILIFCVVSFFLNLLWTTLVQRFLCSKKTETELLLLIPKNFIYKFESCN